MCCMSLSLLHIPSEVQRQCWGRPDFGLLRCMKENALLYFSVGKKVAHGGAACRAGCDSAALESVCKTWKVLVKSPETKAAGLPGLCASHFLRGLLGKGFPPWLQWPTVQLCLHRGCMHSKPEQLEDQGKSSDYCTAATRIRSNALQACTPRAYLVTSHADSLDFLTQFCYALLHW